MEALPLLVLPVPASAGAALVAGPAAEIDAAATPFAALLDALAPAPEAAPPAIEVTRPEAIEPEAAGAAGAADAVPAPDAALAAQLAWQAPPPVIDPQPAVPVDAATAAAPTPPRKVTARPPGETASDPLSATVKTSADTPAPADTAPDASFLAAFAPREIAPRTPTRHHEFDAGRAEALVAIGHRTAAAATERPIEPPAPAVSIHAAPDTPEFAAELAARVNVLARDGVQRAELRMNPAELGPVAVQITLDGRDARVDFGAEVAGTRAAIEASLPVLAAALRDSGLVLAGGGVSSQTPADAGSGRQHDEAHAQHRGGTDVTHHGADTKGTAGADGAAVPRRVRIGAIDLYA